MKFRFKVSFAPNIDELQYVNIEIINSAHLEYEALKDTAIGRVQALKFIHCDSGKIFNGKFLHSYEFIKEVR